MKVEYVEKLPKRLKNDVVRILDEFARTDKNVMKITDEAGEYKDIKSLRNSFFNAIRRSGRPWHITGNKREIYIVKDIGK